MAKKKRRPVMRNNSSNTIVVKSASSKADWFRIVLWIVIAVLVISTLTPIVIAIGGWTDDVSDWLKGITGTTVVDPPSPGNTSDGQTTETRILSANALLKELDPEEDMPATFDDELLSVWEENSYTKILVHKNSSGNLVYSMIYKFYTEETLNTPMYVYSYNLTKAVVYNKPWAWWHYLLNVAIAWAINQEWDYVAEHYWTSSDGTTWNLADSYNWSSLNMFVANQEEDAEVIRFRFNERRKPASLFWELTADVETFKRTNQENAWQDDYVNYAVSISKKNNGQWIGTNDKAGMRFEFFRLSSDDFKSNKPISITKLYKLFPNATQATKFEVLEDLISFKIPKDDAGVEDFTVQEQWGYKKFIEYSFNNVEMLTEYKAYALDEYVNVRALPLRAKVKSIYFYAINSPIQKTVFTTPNSTTSKKFLTEITTEGLRIITLPYAVSTTNNVNYQFQIIQKNTNGNQLGATLLSNINVFTATTAKKYENQNFVIPFDTNFVLQTGVKTIEITIIGQGTNIFDGSNSILEVA